MAIAELGEKLTDDDFAVMRIALEDRIISNLRVFKTWEPRILVALKSYYKIGGDWTKENFEGFIEE